ncbi:MAG TPA: SDR family oxidoreductase [Anaerolineaceae bacterium]|nr:SDR family oxidoreductase [Anaerolineaceae bacterium]HPN49967.1 SDR family oxidoreductase [Anaerolineaceae bacterium]
MNEMQGKTILITGSTDGIGRQTALELMRLGGRVILHGRSAERCQAAALALGMESGLPAPEFLAADLSSQAQVRALAEAVRARADSLDVLINNAGVYMAERKLTEDGFETTFAVNYLAPFLLTRLLLEKFTASQPARVINISSVGYKSARWDWENLQGEKRYHPWGAYCISKLALVMMTVDLGEEWITKGVTVNALHPGTVDTKMLRSLGMQGDSLEQGARLSVHLASSAEVKGISGKYFDHGQVEELSTLAQDGALRTQLRQMSLKMTGLES